MQQVKLWPLALPRFKEECVAKFWGNCHRATKQSVTALLLGFLV